MPTKKLVLSGTPKSTNDLYKSVCMGGRPRTYLTNEGKELKRSYTWELKSQWGGEDPIVGAVCVEIWLYFGDKRKRDWDNWHKLTMDAGNRVIYKDDSQITDAIVHKRIEKDNPRIEIDVMW